MHTHLYTASKRSRQKGVTTTATTTAESKRKAKRKSSKSKKCAQYLRCIKFLVLAPPPHCLPRCPFLCSNKKANAEEAAAEAEAATEAEAEAATAAAEAHKLSQAKK